MLYLSDFVERHRSDYYDLLQRVRTHGEWIPWLRYFLTGVERTARDAALRARRLLELRETMMRKAERALVDQLFVNPYITISKAAEVLGVSQPTATKVLKKLEADGVLKETTRRTWGKVYLARGVLAAIETPAKTG